jgi:hypothetical protein
MRQNPERLAWMILLVAFVTFCVSAVGCPVMAYNYLLNARRPLPAQVDAQRGTVRVERKGNTRPDAVSLDAPTPLELFKGDGLRTGRLDEGLLTLHLSGDQENPKTLITAVAYGNSDVVLKDAYSPRFGLSSGAQTAILQVKGGRIRLEVLPAGDGRPVRVEVYTDHARIQLNEGYYILEVTNQQTVITVRSGQANVRSKDQELVLGDKERAVVSLESTLGPLATERNLIANGDFEQGLETGWVLDIAPADPSARISNIKDEDGRSVVWFQHDQPQPLEISLIQTLDQNVQNVASLILYLKVRVNYQSLSVCGQEGTECPMMVRIDYTSEDGGDRQWVHGFYALDDPNVSDEYYYCHTCPEPSSGEHNRVPEKTWVFYESPNLMETFRPELRPVTIQSVRIYASGHTFDAMVANVELLAQE